MWTQGGVGTERPAGDGKWDARRIRVRTTVSGRTVGSAAGKSRFWSRAGAFLGRIPEKPWLALVPVVLVVAAAALGVWLYGKARSEDIVTVQQFEVTPEAAAKLGITGKGAADLVIGTMDTIAADAESFHGADYYAYDHKGVQPVSLSEHIRVPVESTYDIDVHGISVDMIARAYRCLRYTKWVVSGDIVPGSGGSGGYAVVLRMDRADEALSWQEEAAGPADVAAKVKEVTKQMLKQERPEVIGSALLRQASFFGEKEKKDAIYAEAEQVFRDWAMRQPREWRPYQYLSLAYGEAQKGAESASVAGWSKRIQKLEADGGTKARERGSMTRDEIPAVTQAVWDARVGDEEPATGYPDAPARLLRAKRAERDVEEHCSEQKGTLSCRLEFARVLAAVAKLEGEVPAERGNAYSTQERAVRLLADAVRERPEDGGVREQHAVVLQGLVSLGKEEHKDPALLGKLKAEEGDEFTRALELRPEQTSPLWGAAYVLLDEAREQDALELGRMIALLQPQSMDAKLAYILTLDGEMKREGVRPAALEQEMEVPLAEVLKTATDSQLKQAGYIVRRQEDTRTLARIADVGRARFGWAADVFATAEQTSGEPW